MKKRVLLIIVLCIVILFNIGSIMNLLLNITYSVREIPFTNRIEGLEGIKDVILIDYYNSIFLIIIDMCFLIGLTVIIFRISQRKNN